MIRSVSILIPTHNRCDLLSQTLQSLSALQIPSDLKIELIVVANACTDQTVDVCEKILPHLPFSGRCVVEPTPGVSVARNRAVTESQGELCAWLDDDIIADRQWLVEMVKVYATHDAEMVGGKVNLWWQEAKKPDWVTDRWQGFFAGLDLGDQVKELVGPSRLISANLSFRRSLFDTIGPFRIDLGDVGKTVIHGEDTEFCQRAAKAHARTYYTPHAVVKHWVASERLELKNLKQAAAGKGRSHIIMKEAFGPYPFLRSVVGHLYIIASHEPLRWWALLRGNQEAVMTHLLLRIVGQTGLAEGLRRGLRLGRCR